MKGLGRNNLLKRISALVLAVLMVFTMMPLETSVFKADNGTEQVPGDGQTPDGGDQTTPTETTTYTFDVYKMVAGEGEGAAPVKEAITTATIAVYTSEAKITPSSETSTVVEVPSNATNATYEVRYTADGIDYYASGVLAGDDTTIEVELGNNLLPTTGLTGTIYTAYVNESNNTPAAGFSINLYDGVSEEPIATTTSRVDGSYILIANKNEDVTYTIKVEATANTVAYAGEITRTFVNGKITEQEDILLTAKKDATLVFGNVTPDPLTVSGSNNTFTNTLTCTDVQTQTVVNVESMVNYSSSNNNIATVDPSSGVVTAVAPGTATITASFANNEYKLATASYTIVVSGITYSGVVKDENGEPISGADVRIIFGGVSTVDEGVGRSTEGHGEVELETDENGIYSYSSEYKSNCTITVEHDGFVTKNEVVTVPNDAGAYVLIENNFDLEYVKYTISGTVTVSNTVDGVTNQTPLSGQSIVLLKDNNIVASATTGTDGKYSFTVVPGTYTVRVESEEYKKDSRLEKIVLYTDIENVDLALVVKDSLELKTTISRENIELLTNIDLENQIHDFSFDTDVITSGIPAEPVPYTVSFVSTNTDVIKVNSSNGAITEIIGNGTASIKAVITSDDYNITYTGDSKLECSVNVSTVEYDEDSLNVNVPVEMTYGDSAFSVKLVLVGETEEEIDFEDVAYVSSNPEVAKIVYIDEDENELTFEELTEDTVVTDVVVKILKASSSPVNITATYDYSDQGGETTDEVSVSFDLKVNKITSLPEFKWTGYDEITDIVDGQVVINHIYGNPIKNVVVSSAVGTAVTYSSSNTDIVEVENTTGAISAINKTGTVTITAKIVDENNYHVAPITYTINVTKGDLPGFTWDSQSLLTISNIAGYSVGVSETDTNITQISTTYKKDIVGFTLPAVSTGTGTITYKYQSSHTNVATVNETTGEVTIIGAGTTTITCLAESAGYNDKVITYVIKVTPAGQNITWQPTDWTPEGFQLTGGTVTLEYKAGLQYTIGVVGQVVDNKLSYGFTLEEITGYQNVATLADPILGTVNVLNVGEVNVIYNSKDIGEVAGSGIVDRYNDVTIGYKLVVVHGQEDLKWNTQDMASLDQIAVLTDAEGNEVSTLPTTGGTALIVYENGANFTLGASGGNADLDYSYTVSNNDGVITLDEETGKVIVNKAGTVTITYKATNSTNNYEKTELNYKLIIAKADQDGFVWADGSENGTVKTVVYDPAEQVVVPLGVKDFNDIKEYSETSVQYFIEITEGNSNAIQCSQVSGQLVIHEAAKAKITAKIGATTNYNAKTITYELVVEKADDTIAFDKNSLTIINGQLSYVLPVITTDNDGAGSGDITYSISANTGVATIANASTGELSFGLQPGTVTVTATKAADNQYKAATATYTLTVNEWNPLATGQVGNYYTISGTKIDSATPWYTTVDQNHPISLTAKDGYQLYKGLEDPVPTTTWSSSINITSTHDGTDNVIVYYIRETATGYVSKQYSIINFHVDTTAPSAAIAVDDATVWEKILSFFTFNVAGQEVPELEITYNDATSGIKSVQYYVSTGVVPMTANGALDVTTLENVATWTTYTGTVDLLSKNVGENVIYTKVIDNAGHVTYAHTNGLIFDGAKPVVTPTIVTENSNGIYYGNVEIKLDVVDAAPYSGIQEITYVVENGSTVTDRGTLFTFQPAQAGNPQKSELVSAWNSASFSKNVIVKAADNNSDNVKVTFKVTDNAGNVTESVVNLMIDISAPVVSVAYDNNNGDTTFADGVFYNANRTAVITVKDRHFDTNNTKLIVTNTDGVVPTLSGWTKVSNGTGNGDDTAYQATVVFAADGDYTFDFSCVDLASNRSGAVNYGTSQAPTAFTIDKTAPMISVSYNNNDALNENYFKADRTATVVIQEHNFNASRVNAIITATDDGQTIGAPSISGWSSSGDTHTATITYSADALYTFDIEYADKAGNEIAEFAPQTFYVDKTMPSVSITEIVDLSANNAEKIGFVITATDTNFDVFTPVLTAVIQTENGFTTTELNVASVSEITNGRVYTVDNLESDGIYSIKCTVVDKAGNAYTEVNLQRADGSTYVENRAGEDTLLMFSVNRGGSVFDVDANTKDVLDRYYVQNVENDVVIYEVNANELSSYAISLNGTDLVEGTDYTVSSTGGNGEWMRYTYTVNKDLFEAEGEYILVVSSTDGATNDAFSDVKNANIKFVVDRTAPIVTVTGMESNRSYQTEEQTVTIMPTDDGGMIESLIIRIMDRNGELQKELAYSGEELRELLNTNGGTITFTLGNGINQKVQIICTDAAFNADGVANTYDQTFENITVSASAVALFFAGDTMLYIGAGVATTAAAGGGIFFFRRFKMPKIKK